MKKQISGGIVLSFISQVITIVIGLMYTPLMIRILGQDEYGLYQLSQSIVNYLNLMNLGFNGAYIRYYSIAKTKDDKDELANVNGLFMKTFLVLSFLSIIGGIVLIGNITLLGSNISESQYVTARILMAVLVINLAFSFPNSLFIAYMSANERFVFQKAINIFFNILIPVLNLPLLYMGYGSIGIVSVTLFLTIIRFIVNVLYCYKRLGYEQNIKYFEKNIFKDLFKYTFFIFLSDLVDQLNSNVDKLLLGSLMGTVSVAIYSVAYNMNHYRTILSWIIPEMYVPQINRLVIEDKNQEKTSLLFTKVGRYNNYIMVLVISGFVLVGKPFISLWVGTDYGTSYYCTIILMISGYIAAVQTLGVNVQNAMNMHRMRSIVYFIIACLNVVFSIFLIKQWGVIGTCLGTLIATILGSGLFMNYYYAVKLKLDIVGFWKEILKWLLPAVALFVVFYLLISRLVIESWLILFSVVIVYVAFYCLLLLLIGLRKDEKERLLSLIKR